MLSAFENPILRFLFEGELKLTIAELIIAIPPGRAAAPLWEIISPSSSACNLYTLLGVATAVATKQLH